MPGGLFEFVAAEEVGEADGPGVGTRLAQRGLRRVGRPGVGEQARGEGLGPPLAAHPAPELLVGDGDAQGAAEHLAHRLVVRRAGHHAAVAPLVRGGGADREAGRQHQVDLAGQPLRAPAELVQYPGQLFVPFPYQVGHGTDGSGRPSARGRGPPGPPEGARGVHSAVGNAKGRLPIREAAFRSCGATGN